MVFCYMIILLLSGQMVYSADMKNVRNQGGLSFECNKQYRELNNDGSKEDQATTFDVLPGHGWDNLRNEPQGPVSSLVYFKCVTANNGKYLIPDNVFFLPNKQSNVDDFAEIIDNTNNYQSATATSINVEVGVSYAGVSVDGKFSHDYQSAKSHSNKEKSTMARVQMRHKFYKILLQPDSSLHPVFKHRIFEIGAHFQSNDSDIAEYLAQLLVRDYGTHLITTIQAGALLIKEDTLKTTHTSDSKTDKTTIAASARASFMSFLQITTSYSQSVSQSSQKAYDSSVTHSVVKTYGGPATSATFNLTEWTNNLHHDLAAIDRSGEPLHFVINPTKIPELPYPTLLQVSEAVKNAIAQYYQFNTHPGCTSPTSPFYNFAANVEDGTCYKQSIKYSLGGLFQHCSLISGYKTGACDGWNYPNTLTNKHNCPEGYSPIHLNKDTVQHSKSEYKCHKSCYTQWILFVPLHKCRKKCQMITTGSQVSVDTYWCAPNGKSVPKSGLLFGGIFTDKTNNPVTREKTCADHFTSSKIGEYISVCVSKLAMNEHLKSKPFGGFYSCSAGNPLVSLYDHNVTNNNEKNSVKACPHGYSAYLAGIEDNCEIQYCTKNVGLNKLHEIQRPPFIKRPNKNLKSVNTLYVQGHAGSVWHKDPQTGIWSTLQETNDKKGLKTAAKENTSGGLSVGAITGIVLVVVIGGIVILSVATIAYKKKNKQIHKNS